LPQGFNDNKGGCAWLAASDPLFDKIADAWMEIMIADFGTDHWYLYLLRAISSLYTGTPAVQPSFNLDWDLPYDSSVQHAWTDRLIGRSRYQCDGFFTGAKPPWYESVAGASSAEAETASFQVRPIVLSKTCNTVLRNDAVSNGSLQNV
jgi:hypothetical protein